MADPRISVVIPVYNAGEYLRQCLKSIVAQTFRDFEVICVDDGSTDLSCSIVEALMADDARIRLVRQKNAGPGVARNAGIGLARGEFLYCCDADDFLMRDMFARCLAAFDSTGVDMVLVAFSTYNQKHARSLFADWSLRHADVYPSYPAGSFTWRTAPDLFFETVQNVPWNKMVRTDMLRSQNIRFQEIYLTEDAMYSLPAAVCANEVVRIARPLVCHREFTHTNAMSDKAAHPLGFVDAFAALKRWLEEQGVYSQLRQAYRAWLLDAVYYNLPTYRTFEGFAAAYGRLTADNLQAFDLAGMDGQGISDQRHRRLLDALREPTQERFLLAALNIFADEAEQLHCDEQGRRSLPRRLAKKLAVRLRR